MNAPDKTPADKPHTWRRRLFRTVRTLALAYLGVVLLLMFLENSMVYQASPAEQHWVKPPSYLGVTDVNIASADGNTLHAWWAVPAGWQPEQGAMLFCHGNGGNLSHRSEALKPWLDQK